MPVPFDPIITPYEFIGDVDSLGSLQLTMLARSFEQIEVGSLADYFPDTMINERTIVIEQQIEGLGIMPIVRFGVPGGGFVDQDRIRSMMTQPAVVREEDFLDMAFINQLRQVGTFNQAINPNQKIAERMQKLMNRRQRTLDLFRAKVLLGGISYTDPRTNVSIDVATNIPAHNFFAYNGWGGTAANVNANDPIPGMTQYRALGDLTGGPNGRTEALFFTSSDGYAGVPWTHPRADIVRCLRLIRQYLWRTNKNRFLEMVISSDLKTVIETTNEYIRSYQGTAAVLHQQGTVATGGTELAGQVVSGDLRNVSPQFVQLGPGGELVSIAGLRIRVLDGIYRDPVDRQIKTYWPSHKVAIVAPSHFMDASARLGMTQHCVGEAEDGQPGVWSRTSGPQDPPSPPGRTLQVGDAFLPFAIYPHWICLMDVAEPEVLADRLILHADLNYGTF